MRTRIARSRAAPTAAAAVATARVAKCSLSLSLSLVHFSRRHYTLPRRKKHLASREARIHAAVTQLSRGPPCPTSSGVHCHVPLSPPSFSLFLSCMFCSLLSIVHFALARTARDPAFSVLLSFPPSNLRWPRNEQRVYMYVRARDKAAVHPYGCRNTR